MRTRLRNVIVYVSSTAVGTACPALAPHAFLRINIQKGVHPRAQS